MCNIFFFFVQSERPRIIILFLEYSHRSCTSDARFNLRPYFLSMTETSKEAIDHVSIRGYATAACVCSKKRQLPNITGGRTPCQGCLEVLDFVARVGPGLAYTRVGEGEGEGGKEE